MRFSVPEYAYKTFALAYRDDFITDSEVEITAKRSVVPPVGQPESSVWPRSSVMESVTARNCCHPYQVTRQLPITEFAHKAAVIGDPPVAAVLAGLDMTAEGRGAAMLDRRHDLELMKAQVSGMGGPISGAGGTEDVGDLERGAHRLSRWVRSLRSGTCRACRAGWSRCAPFE